MHSADAFYSMRGMHTTEGFDKRVSLVMDAEDHARLTEIARAENRDFSKQLRYLIKRCIAEHEQQAEAAA